MKKKDILFLLQFFYPEYISSATLPYDTALKLAENGFTVDVMCGYPHEYADKEKVPYKEVIEGIYIRRIRYLQLDRKKFLGRIVNFLSLTISMLFHLFSMRNYKTIIVYSNPPILPFVAYCSSKLFRCKLVFVAYDLYPEIAVRTKVVSENGLIARVMNFVNDCVYRQAEVIVALSTEMKKYIVENRNIEEDKVVVIPNWYKDEYSESTDDINPFSAVVNGRLAVGYFGNMGIAQDMETIENAIRYYKNDPEVCFILSGHGAKHIEIQEMIAEENIENAYVYGFLRGKDYLDALRSSDCAIVSLQKGLTGLCVPSKTYGYMMQGVPIIAIMEESDIVCDVKNGAGYHVAGNSHDVLIGIIEKIKMDRLDCRHKGKQSRQIYLQNYTPDICLDQYLQLAKGLCS